MTPLEAAIKKWQGIRDGIEGECGPSDDPLCLAYGKDSENCYECPVVKRTGCSGCLGTPHQEWLNHHIESHGGTDSPLMVLCPVCREIAVKEIQFLTSLLVSKVVSVSLGEIRDLEKKLELLKKEFLNNEGWKEGPIHWWTKELNGKKIVVTSVDAAMMYEE